MRVAATTSILLTMILGCAGPIDPAPEPDDTGDPGADRAEEISSGDDDAVVHGGGEVLVADGSRATPAEVASALPSGCELWCRPCAGPRCPDGRCEIRCGRPAAPKASVPPGHARCSADDDCRLYSNYCKGCACDALRVGAPDPRCPKGELVQCFADPCMDQRAACVAGTCTAVRK